jgi:Domain of unknown function (DUF4124)
VPRILLMSLLLSSAVAWADIYKCPNGKGSVSLQQEPCRTGEAPVIEEHTPYQVKQVLKEAVASLAGKIGQLALPTNYAEQIDKAFVQRLKDPASRQIGYIGKPYGSAVCGTINAKNSFGGYTGQQVFLAYFNGAGDLAHLEIYKDEDFKSLKYSDDLDATLIRQCGILPPQ